MKHTKPALDARRRRALKARAHHLKPVVLIGQKGWHDGLRDEIEQALDHHELLKIKIAGTRAQADVLIATLLEHTGAALIQHIGSTATIFRERPKPR